MICKIEYFWVTMLTSLRGLGLTDSMKATYNRTVRIVALSAYGDAMHMCNKRTARCTNEADARSRGKRTRRSRHFIL